MKYIFAVIFIIVSLYACKKDDDEQGIIEVPSRDRAEQQLEEDEIIQNYLKTHFYRLVDNDDDDPKYKIPVFDTIAGVNSGQTSIWDVQIPELPIDPETPNDTRGIEAITVERDEVAYKIYILKLHQGSSTANSPTFADSTLVTYRGELFYDNVDKDGDGIPDEADVDADGDGIIDAIDNEPRLDSDQDGIADDSDVDTDPNSIDTDGDGIIDDKDPVDNNDINRRLFDNGVTPQWFEQISVILGWREVLQELKGASGVTVNNDGTASYSDFGNIIAFIPSGLAYYNSSSPTGGIPFYSPLIFNIQLYDVEEADHDGDGIPSYLEDVDGDGRLFGDIDDDTDSDEIPNYLDFDDDNDRTLTRDEVVVEDLNGDGFLDIEINPTVSGEIRYFDDDGDGVYNHLDDDDKEIKE